MALKRTVCGVENLTTIEASTPVWDTRLVVVPIMAR